MSPTAPALAARPRPLRVAIEARLASGTFGGVEQVVIGLASGLSRLGDGDEEYLFLTHAGADGWLAPHVGGPARLLPCAPPPPRPSSALRRELARIPGLLWAWTRWTVRVAASDGAVERAGADVVHFPFQSGFLTEIPSIYHPHDLQHVHLPRFFPRAERAWRDIHYRTLCARARMVAVTSSWIRRDLVRQYGLPPEKIEVIPLAPVVGAYAQPSAGALALVRRELDLPASFALYPAQTWPHKNHLGLVRAIAALRRDHGITVPLVCSGKRTEHLETILREVRRLGLSDVVRFVGFVTPAQLQALYGLARCVVIPTLFEAASFPLWEAFENGVPAACSNVTSLPEQAGDAALVFDPHDERAMAEALRGVFTDEALRRALVERGRARVSAFTWDRTARTFRAHYRRIAGRALTDEDRSLLSREAGL